MAHTDELLTADDLATRCQVSKQTVYFWNKTGAGPRYIKVGRHVRYREADIEAWLEGNASRKGAARV